MKTLVGILTVFAVASPAPAQDLPPMHPDANIVVGRSERASGTPGGFGTVSADVTTISSSELFPRTAGVTIDSDYGSTATRWITGGPSNFLYAPFRLENGVLLEGLDIYYRDNSAGSNLTVNFCRYWRDAIGGGNAAGDCLASFTSTGTPGDTRDTLLIPPQLQPILRQTNIDADPEVEAVDYILILTFGGAIDGSVRIAQVRPLWRRQVSPAPLVATFPNDVPTTHPQFRFIEALAAAGITAGVGPGSYGPDLPITRGQMAVFLAAALGLHWSPF